MCIFLCNHFLWNMKSKDIVLAETDDNDYLIFSVAVNQQEIPVKLRRAENGVILMQLLSEDIPDILFMDLLLPVKSGKQCIKEIRADERYDELPIIAYTTLQDLDNIEFCYREGANLYVLKPKDAATLVATLRRILSIDWKKILYFPQRSQFVIGNENPR